MKFKFRLLEEILTEAIADVKKQYPNMPDELFYKLIAFDPTYEEGKDRVGTYGKWILNGYNKGNITDADFGHLKDALTRFEDNKKNLKNKDIGAYKTVADLDKMLNDDDSYKELSHRQEVRQRQKDRKNADLGEEADLVFEDDMWEVWVPHTYAASCKLGQGTHWCTASTESDYYYNYYKKNYGGEYYILISKADPDVKFQFHFESEQFMNDEDGETTLGVLFDDDEQLKEFFMPIIRKHLNIGDTDTEEVTLSPRELLDLFDSYNAPNRNAVDGSFCYNIIEEMFGIDSSLWDAVFLQDWTSWADTSYLVDAVKDLEDSDIEGCPFTTEQIVALLEEDEEAYEEAGGDTDFFEDLTGEMYKAVLRAWEDAHIEDTVQEIIKDFKRALKDIGIEVNNDNAVYLRNNKDVIEDYIKYGDAEQAEDLLYDFVLYEPRYGWNEMTDDTFASCLVDAIADEVNEP